MTETFVPGSSNIERVTYDGGARQMTVMFKSGHEYVHHGVGQSDFEALKEADSAGSHYHRHIKGRFVTSRIDNKDDAGGG